MKPTITEKERILTLEEKVARLQFDVYVIQNKIEQMADRKDEPQTEPLQTCSVNGRPYTDCCNCEYFKCTADEPQTEREGE